MDRLLMVPILLPLFSGVLLLLSSVKAKAKMRRGLLWGVVMTALSVSAAVALALVWTGERSLQLFFLLEDAPVFFRTDGIGRLFVTLFSVLFLAAGLFSLPYMKHEGGEERFFGFYLLVYGMLVGLSFSGNLVTMYLFFELVTVVSFPLVLHNGTREAVMAALKYFAYSMCGAYGGLFGIFFLHRCSAGAAFAAGGVLGEAVKGREDILLAAVFVMLVGFGAKAGMFPLHAWLPTAHPVAPSPASAVLSGAITKAGVLAVIRVVYYVTGPELLRGTWVQYAWMTLALVTVFMGSLLAYREQRFKKRLAYSTVSQVSYILFGLSLLTPLGLQGALLHTVAHGVIKSGLFLVAGVFLARYGCERADQLVGIGKKAPTVLWCYTLFALGLVGIPPTIGFLSKWYLAEGALSAGLPLFSYLGPVILLLSALMTAGYLLPVALRGFFPGSGWQAQAGEEQAMPFCFWLPILFLAALTVLLGVFPGFLTDSIGSTVQQLLH